LKPASNGTQPVQTHIERVGQAPPASPQIITLDQSGQLRALLNRPGRRTNTVA